MNPDDQYAIPRFALYGDENHQLQPEFVHIEDIADRSERHDWHIKPHRHGKLFQLLFLDNGSAEVCLDEKNHKLSGYWIITIPPGAVHGFCFPADTQGKVLTMMDSLLEGHEPQIQGYFNKILELPLRIQFNPADVLFKQLLQTFDNISQEIRASQHSQNQMLNCLAKMLLITITRQLENHPQPGQEHNNARKLLINRFKQLLEEHYQQHWTVQQYAQSLNTSTSSLNRLCSEMTGVTAKEIIQHRLLIEIKRRLIYTRLPLDSIAYALGYKDPSYFSRFFKKREGISPGHYRRQKYNETETS
jgi:AraC family transcriptional regulator, transcriptional activator of pobA